MNVTIPPFDNPKVRQAIAYAIPYEDILGTALFDRGIGMFGGPGDPTTTDWPQPSPYKTDLDKAKALLAEAGFPDGFKTTLSYDVSTATTREPIALLVQDSLKKIGVEVEIEKVPGADWYTRLNQKSMPMLIMSFKAWLNYPDYYFYWTYDGENNSVFNAMNYVNPKMDELIATARFESDPAKYAEQVKGFIKIAFDDVPRIPLVQDYRDVAMRQGHHRLHLLVPPRPRLPPAHSARRRRIDDGPSRPPRGSSPRRRLPPIATGFMTLVADYPGTGSRRCRAARAEARAVAGRDGRSGARRRRPARRPPQRDPDARRRQRPRRGPRPRSRASSAARRSARSPACPSVIKDLVLTQGIRTTFGSRLYADYVPDEDDIAVERLQGRRRDRHRQEQCRRIRLWRLRPQPALPDDAQPVGPRRCTPGGSSAGSAAAVAAGIVPMALGSRRRRLGAAARRLHRHRRHEADHGPHPGLAGLPRRDASRASRAGSRSSTTAR